MSETQHTPTPPVDVPLDQTEGPIYYDGGAVQRDIARFWRKLRSFFARSRSDR